MYAGYIYNFGKKSFIFNERTVNYLETLEEVSEFLHLNRGKVILITHAYNHREMIIEVDEKLMMRISNDYKTIGERMCRKIIDNDHV